jgi:copper(I)-binding protein
MPLRDDPLRMKRIVACTSLAALALAACGSDDGGIAIEGAWARTSAEGQTTGAVYFEITADEADRLVAASVPASVAATAEIHEVVMADMSDDGEMDMGDEMSDDGEMDMGDDMSGDGEMDMGGMDPQMRMQELVDGLPLPAGETITLEPGGYHVMLLDIAEPLEVGDEIELTLDFENADDMTLTVEVAESAP